MTGRLFPRSYTSNHHCILICGGHHCPHQSPWTLTHIFLVHLRSSSWHWSFLSSLLGFWSLYIILILMYSSGHVCPLTEASLGVFLRAPSVIRGLLSWLPSVIPLRLPCVLSTRGSRVLFLCGDFSWFSLTVLFNFSKLSWLSWFYIYVSSVSIVCGLIFMPLLPEPDWSVSNTRTLPSLTSI